MDYRMDVQADSPPGRTHLTMLSTDIRTGSRRCFSSACGLDREIFSEFVEMALYRGPSKCAVSQANIGVISRRILSHIPGSEGNGPGERSAKVSIVCQNLSDILCL